MNRDFNAGEVYVDIESTLDSRWDHAEDFLEALCADEVDAIIEARAQFGLDPLE